MSDRSDRKAELERKKERLKQIRLEKQSKNLKKEEEKKIAVTVSSGLDQKRKDVEDSFRGIFGIDDAATISKPHPTPEKHVADKPVTSDKEAVRPRRTNVANKLKLSKITTISIPPKQTVTYSKGVQTIEEEKKNDSEEEEIENFQKFQKEKVEVEEEEKEAEEEKSDLPELSESEKSVIETSEDYIDFFSRSSRFMERALAHQVDLFTEYNIKTEEESEDRGMKLSINRIFSDERWSRHRMVTSLDWSTHHPELCVAAYGSNDESPYEPEGVTLVWNTKYKTTTPEYIFQCQSSVTTACFAKFHPNLVVGGTYSGQIVVWDNRINKRTAQRSRLSTAAHTHPVYCLDVVGTQNAHNLISISNDGKMCSWSLDMLAQPLESMELQHKQSKSASVMCMAFQHNSVNNFSIGAEDGSVYSACRHGSKAGITEYYEGHTGPVTGIDFHKCPGQFDFSHLLLTSSMDWTIKLWSLKSGGHRFLHSFGDRIECVYDVAWCPSHPAMFASGDCAGRLDLWNFNADMESPVVSTMIDADPAISKLKWNSSGNQIAVGDNYGRVHLADVGEQISTPRADEGTKFVRSITELRNIKQEEEEAKLVSRQL